MPNAKKMLGIDVLTATRQRIVWIFDTFPRICVSFSGGKDSSVMLHLVMDEARKRNQKVGLLFIDWEAQYKLTINYIRDMFSLYADLIDPMWVALPLTTTNAVSQFEPEWTCWDPDRRADWVRDLPEDAITDEAFFPFYRRGMQFEEFVPAFGEWYSQGELTACLVGIRTDESLNRWRTIKSTTKVRKDDKQWTTEMSPNVFNCYPLYDWRTQDIWTYNGREKKPYNQLYDRMYQAGVGIHQQRICEPYGPEQRKGLWLFHVIEPDTWARVVARVNGANQGALYATDNGNILGRLKITRPEGKTWKEFVQLLLATMPPTLAEHYRNKIAVFVRWYQTRGFPTDIPDEAPRDLAADYPIPSWRRVCKSLLRNDYWCRGLNFSQTKSYALDKYKSRMAKRRGEWDLPGFLSVGGTKDV